MELPSEPSEIDAKKHKIPLPVGRIPFLLKLGAILSFFMLIVPIILALNHSSLMVASDFVMTFYVVGKMILSGHGQAIYPDSSAATFVDAPFDIFAHKILPSLHERNTAIYMYSPLVACLFVPFAFLGAIQALVAWQATSIISLLLCARIHLELSTSSQVRKKTDGTESSKEIAEEIPGEIHGEIHRAPNTKRDKEPRFIEFLRIIGLGAMFTPVFQQLLIGHLGIPLGMLPLSLGYLLAAKNRFFWAGAVWALIFMKPQFMPIVLLIVGAYTLTGRFSLLGGFAAGSILVACSTIFCLGPQTAMDWLGSMRLSDAIFTDPRYSYPHYLAVSIPSAILQSVPETMRETAKVPAYLLAALIGLITLARARRILVDSDSKRGLALITILGIFVLPLVLPHFLFYDLCVFAIAAFIIHHNLPDDEQVMRLRLLRVIGFAFINLYFFAFFFLRLIYPHIAQPIVLVAFLTIWFVMVFRSCR